MHVRRILAVLAVVALVAAGCGGDDEGTETTATTEAAEGRTREVTVQVDAEGDDPNMFALAYFPGTVKVHPGDTVVFESNFTGEPHTITFGTLITPAIEAVEKATPEELEADEPPPAFQPLLKYSMLPEGPGDANQVSANPCFVATGELPADTTQPCPVQEPAPFTGKEVFYNSGFLADGDEFEVKLADDIAPGTYRGFCMLHFTEMVSTITVVPESEDVPSADAVRAQGDKEIQALAAKAKEAHEKARAATAPGAVLAGDPPGEEGEQGGPPKPNTTVGLAEFTPEEISVKTGDSVTWNINGPHSVTFNAPEDARVVVGKGPDGRTHVVEKAVSPALFKVPPPPQGEPEGPPPTVDLGSYDGTGFASTGLQFGGSYKVTFTKPGTYKYICVVHPDMEGTINVT